MNRVAIFLTILSINGLDALNSIESVESPESIEPQPLPAQRRSPILRPNPQTGLRPLARENVARNYGAQVSIESVESPESIEPQPLPARSRPLPRENVPRNYGAQNPISAYSQRQKIKPEITLDVGRLVEEFEEQPKSADIILAKMDPSVFPLTSKDDLKKALLKTEKDSVDSVEKVHGKELSNDVETARYVPNPTKKLIELKANGQFIQKVQGRIVAGDPVELDVVDISRAASYFHKQPIYSSRTST